MTKSKRKKYFILFSVLLAVAVIAVTMILACYWRRQEANEDYETLVSEVNKTEAERQPATEQEDILAELGIQVPNKNLDWDKLHEENADIYAWIYVPDTTVDYPVLQHPEDNAFYLDHNMDGSKGYPGCIYTENYNSKDFTDNNTVLYGHNLKDKTMFSSLHNFEDATFVNEDHYVYVYTEEKVFVYKIFGAYERDAMHLLANEDLSNEYVYERYLNSISQVDSRIKNIRQDVEVTAKDRIITLSTCTFDHNSELRFLVQGVLLNP